MFSHNKETQPLSLYLFQEFWASIPSLLARNLQKKKQKNVSTRSYIIRKQHTTHHPHKYLFQESWASIPSLLAQNLQKKEKER